jgi:hypothetical protein
MQKKRDKLTLRESPSNSVWSDKDISLVLRLKYKGFSWKYVEVRSLGPFVAEGVLSFCSSSYGDVLHKAVVLIVLLTWTVV